MWGNRKHWLLRDFKGQFVCSCLTPWSHDESAALSRVLSQTTGRDPKMHEWSRSAKAPWHKVGTDCAWWHCCQWICMTSKLKTEGELFPSTCTAPTCERKAKDVPTKCGFFDPVGSCLITEDSHYARFHVPEYESLGWNFPKKIRLPSRFFKFRLRLLN